MMPLFVTNGVATKEPLQTIVVFLHDNNPLAGQILHSSSQFRYDWNPPKFIIAVEYKVQQVTLDRGVCGVYDIEDLIALLRREKAEDVFVAELPPEARYVDYIVIVNGRSRRHMTALTEIVRKVFKKKRHSTDILPRIEGETSSDWMALDLGNIALHIFSRNARSVYDLESLWSVGPEFDPLINSPDDALTALMKKHSISFQDFQSKGQLL